MGQAMTPQLEAKLKELAQGQFKGISELPFSTCMALARAVLMFSRIVDEPALSSESIFLALDDILRDLATDLNCRDEADGEGK